VTQGNGSGSGQAVGSGRGISEGGPARAGAVLATLILVAAIANLPLAVANVALPDIGLHFDASQTQLNMVAVGYSLGLAASVLWLGALGDRYGRKSMMLIGVCLSLPACLVAAWAPSIEVLIGARILGGLAAGMAYPTTLSLITALWVPGASRTKSIALWSATGGALSALGPLMAGLLLEHYWWGSVFLVTLPLIVLGVPMVIKLIPAHVNEDSDPVDSIGGVLSVLLVGALILGINFLVVPDKRSAAIAILVFAVIATIAFAIRQKKAANPLYDLTIAARSTFWVAALAGIIVFGSLMGAMFIGQQFLQNVLDYSTIDAGLAIIPAALFMVVLAPRSAKIVEARGARFTLLVGYVPVLLGFLTMLLLWKEGIPYWKVGLAYAFVGAGVGIAGTPASRSLTGSVPVRRAGMASGTADLQRDLGGAIMQSIFGALLTAGYAKAFSALIAGGSGECAANVTSQAESQLTKSYASAATMAKQPEFEQCSTQIIEAARQSFIDGQDAAYLAGIAAVVLGAVLVFFVFPKHRREQELLEEYHAEDAAVGVADPSPA
jgi:EmrB/QacA subfamily drug resistance transporter